MGYYIGLDNGETELKAAIYTAEGEQIGLCSAEIPETISQPEFRERDMELMWGLNCTLLRELLTKTAIDPAEIAAIACCGHGKGLYLWGKDNKAVRHGILPTDNRAWAYSQKWENDGTARKVFGLSYQKILACQPISLLAWLKEYEPANFANIKWVFSCKDYVRFRLTGEAFTEITDASSANLLNLTTHQYDAELLSLFDLKSLRGALPMLRESTDICGHITKQAAKLTGLKAGTPVVGGMLDIDACAIAVDVVTEGRMCMISGARSITEYISRNPVLDGTITMNSLFCIPEYYLIEECSPISVVTNECFITNILPELAQQAKQQGDTICKVADGLVSSLPASEFCPVFLPFLMSDKGRSNAKAAFVGISNTHSRAHLLKSLYEGVAFGHKYHFDRLQVTRAKPIEVIRLAGCVADSEVWTQIFADLMGYPIERVSVEQVSVFGCAMTAAVGVGEYKDFADAALHMIRVKSRIEPIPEHRASYLRKYALYAELTNALNPVWSDAQQVAEH